LRRPDHQRQDAKGNHMSSASTRLANRIKAVVAYKRGVTEIDYFPPEVWIELTSVCNLACIMCPTGLGLVTRPTGFMSFDVFRTIIDDVAPHRPTIMMFLGGESLLNKKAIEMIAYAKSKEVTVSLNTNGTVFTEKLFRALLDVGLDSLTFSFDGYTKAVYERIRVKANYEKVVSNIQSLLRMKKDLGLVKPFVTIYTLAVTEESLENEAEFTQRFEGLPVDRFSVDTPRNWAGVLESGGEVQLTEMGARVTPCHRVWKTTAVLWDGTVVPCCADFSGDMPMGNVKDRPLTELLNTDTYRQLRRAMVARDLEAYPLCRGCDETRPKKTIAGVPVDMLNSFKSEIAETILGERATGWLRRTRYRERRQRNPSSSRTR
jgi:radical SAM protein with 4Fe4S-binding SPASM domain